MLQDAVMPFILNKDGAFPIFFQQNHTLQNMLTSIAGMAITLPETDTNGFFSVGSVDGCRLSEEDK